MKKNVATIVRIAAEYGKTGIPRKLYGLKVDGKLIATGNLDHVRLARDAINNYGQPWF